jgi:hypothetical protein
LLVRRLDLTAIRQLSERLNKNRAMTGGHRPGCDSQQTFKLPGKNYRPAA